MRKSSAHAYIGFCFLLTLVSKMLQCDRFCPDNYHPLNSSTHMQEER